MKYSLIISILFLYFGLTVLVSCKKEHTTFLTRNRPPVVNAGPDLSIILPQDRTLLAGYVLDPEDGINVKVEWLKIAGPSQFILLNSNTVTAKLNNLIEGVYKFELKGTDKGGLMAKDTVEVNVSAGGGDPCYGCWDY